MSAGPAGDDGAGAYETLLYGVADAKRFIELAEREGVSAAVAERDAPFGDYSQAGPAAKPDPSNTIEP